MTVKPQIQKIEVNLGASLSLQMHFHRTEYWVVFSGTAKIKIDNVKKLIGPNERFKYP